MSEHVWLLKENVENAPVGKLLADAVRWSPALKRGFIGDWLEMRKLLANLIADVEADARMRRAGKLPWWSLRDANAMLGATTDD